MIRVAKAFIAVMVAFGVAAAADELGPSGGDAGETRRVEPHPRVNRNALSPALYSDLWVRAPAHQDGGLGVEVAYVFRGLFAVGLAYEVDMARSFYPHGSFSVWFGGITGRAYYRRCYENTYDMPFSIRPYAGGGGGRCRIPVQGEMRGGYYANYNYGFELILWPMAVDINVGGHTEFVGETATYFAVGAGLRFFL